MDFHCFFDGLTQIAQRFDKSDFIALFKHHQTGQDWLNDWQKLRDNTPETINRMLKSNPRLIARNHQVETAIANIVKDNDYQGFNRLCNALRDPYVLTPDDKELQLPPKDNERVLRTYCGT